MPILAELLLYECAFGWRGPCLTLKSNKANGSHFRKPLLLLVRLEARGVSVVNYTHGPSRTIFQVKSVSRASRALSKTCSTAQNLEYTQSMQFLSIANGDWELRSCRAVAVMGEKKNTLPHTKILNELEKL
jgi:hypothetical protein